MGLVLALSWGKELKREEETKMIEERLQESETHFRSIIETASDAIISIDSRANIKTWNRQAETMFGYSHDEITGKPLTAIIPKQFREGFETEFKHVLSKGEPPVSRKPFELAGLRKDGSQFQAELSVNGWQTSEETFFTAIIRDITQRKQMEEELRKSNEFNAGIIKQSPHPILLLAEDGTVTHVNRALEKLTGYSSSELVGMKAPLPFWIEQTPSDKHRRNRIAALEGKEQKFEERFRSKNGEIFWVEVTPTAIIVNGKPQHYLNIWMDITQRKRVEEELKESNEFNLNLIDQSPHPTVVADTETTIDQVNQALERLTGYSSSELIGLKVPYPWWTEDIPKDKGERDRRAALAGKGQKFEEKFRKKNGDIFWVELVPGIVVINDKVIKHFATWTDITERKKMEGELRQAAEEWQATFDSITDLVSIQDKDFKLVRVNRAYADAFGMKPEELIGRACYEVVHGRDKPIPNCPHLKTLKTKKAAISDFFEPHLGIHLEVATSPVFNEKGEFIAIVHLAKDVTERKQIEEELKESNQFNSSLIEQSPHPILVTDWDSTILRVNKALEQLTGYSSSELVGIKVPFSWYAEQDTKKKKDRDLKAALARRGQKFEEKFHKKNGGPFWVEVTPTTVIVDGKLKHYLNIWTDITERKRVEEELKRNNQFNYNLFKQSPHPVLVTEKDTTIVEVNHALEDLTGYSSSELIGLKVPYPWWPEEIPKDKDKRDHKAALAGKGQKFEERFIAKNGEYFWIELIPAAVMIDNKLINYLAIWTDITQRKQMEEELKERYQQERKLHRELEAEIRKRIEFTRIIVHELKTPLTSIMLSSDLLTAELKEQLPLDLAQSINRSTVNLNSRIDELLDMARGEMGMLKLKIRPLDLRQLLSSAASDMAPAVSSHKQSLTLKLPASLPLVMADEDRLRQIILNLLSNASKFTPDGGKITLRAREKAASLILEVEDTGPGISDKNQKWLFEPYYRVERERERISGLGLGLALSKTLVELHGGQIWVKSQVGQGSTFGFSLPLENYK